MDKMSGESQAILFLTHVRSARVLAHLERLRRETADLMPVFACVDERTARADTLTDFPGDFRVDPEDWRALVPVRAAELDRGLPATDYYDLFYLPALCSERLRGFDRIWFIEADVDFAGDWGDFFRVADACPADLLTTTLYPRPLQPRWVHWKRVRTPAHVPPQKQLRAFLPLARFSRRLIDAYVEEIGDSAWGGHFEALWPTIAALRGFTLADPGGSGPFRWDGPRFYRNTYRRMMMSPGTFVYRPARGHFFHEAPEGFEPGQLHHPVKGW